MRTNRGKKYKKLRGFEQATPETEARANEFMKWYGDNFRYLCDKLNDDGLATDTALYLYDCIALKGLIIKDYKSYFIRASFNIKLNALKKQVPLISTDDEKRVLQLSASDYNYGKYEDTVDQLKDEILEYVRAKYDEVAVSLFEIYIGLQPHTSYKRLSVMLDIPITKIWTKITPIRKDIVKHFENRKGFLLSNI